MTSSKRGMGSILVMAALVFSGCHKSPFERTRDANGSSGTGSITGSKHLVVFSNELKTGGGAFLYPGSENQTLSFSDTSNPVSARSIRYVWNGGDVSNPSCPPAEHTFAGFDLMQTPFQTTFMTSPARNLTGSGYGKVTFYARGSLGANVIVKIEVAAPGFAGGCGTPPPAPCIVLSSDGLTDSTPACGKLGQLAGSWGSYSTSGLAPSDLASIRDFFKATMIYAGAGTGTGGTVYFDQIEYAP